NFGYKVKNVSDRLNKEIMTDEIYDIFKQEYVNVNAPIEFVKYHFAQHDDFETVVKIRQNNEVREFTGTGNGRLDAISSALQSNLNISFSNLTYKEDALDVGSTSQAVSYISITAADGVTYWGCG